MPRTPRPASGWLRSTPCRSSAPSALADRRHDGTRRWAGRPRWWVVGLSSLLVLALGTTAWLTLRTPTYHAPLRRPTVPQAAPDRAATLLHDLADAVRRDDPVAAGHLAAS